MHLLTQDNASSLWQETIRQAESQCAISLRRELESYLIQVLVSYTHQSPLGKQSLGLTYLEAQSLQNEQRKLSLQEVGDRCLILSGLFPRIVQRKIVTIRYFVDLGRAAYLSLSYQSSDIFGLLAYQFVVLMDVLQSIRPYPDLMPIEAYEQWQAVGSQHALKVLQSYSRYR